MCAAASTLVVRGQRSFAAPVQDRLGGLRTPPGNRTIRTGSACRPPRSWCVPTRSRLRSPLATRAAGDEQHRPGSDQDHHGVFRAPGRAEPQLGLAHVLGAVLEPQRQASVRPHQPLKRYRVPAIGLAVHENFGALLDEPRTAHPDTEDADGVYSHDGN